MTKLIVELELYSFNELKDYSQEEEISEYQMENRDFNISKEEAIDALSKETIKFLYDGATMKRVDMEDLQEYGIDYNVYINSKNIKIK